MRNVENLRIREVCDGAIVSVKAVPGSSRDKIAGVLGEALKITTSSPPEKGKANDAIGRTLAKALGLGRKDVSLAGGQTNPIKEFRVSGMTAAKVRQVLAGV